jgi:phosphatidate cytidylyltransferase
MTLFLVVLQAHFIVQNIFAGLFWFIVPVCLVIANDTFAYLCGITLGQTPLIKISPKKTVEGFVGAWICTIISGIILSHVLIRYSYVICPMGDIGINVFTGAQCKPNAIFLPKAIEIPGVLQNFVGESVVHVEPVHLHVLALATFASLIAPFGGFFASGLKRTFQVKDFGDIIPGHGGITDRMDCQFMMGFFTHLYYQSFVDGHDVTVSSLMRTIITSLPHQEQAELASKLQRYLVDKHFQL